MQPTKAIVGQRNRAPVAAAALGALLAFGAELAGAQAPGPLPERPAYVAMLRADQHRDAGAPADAIAAYREALELFDALARERPDYKLSLIHI